MTGGLDIVLQELHEFLEHDELEDAEYAFFERQIHEVETLKSAIQKAAWGPDG